MTSILSKTDSYTAEKKPLNQDKVIVGLSGSLDSMVATCLLKIQKYDLVAVTIVPEWMELKQPENNLSCHISEVTLNTLKLFCQNLGISHQIISESSEFYSAVIERWMANKVQGRPSTHCWNCHDLRVKILHQKMLDLGATKFATGHFAKLYHQQSGQIFVHSSNDEEHDQSIFLSRLPHEILSSMLLPLSDITRKDVLKLAENFGISSDKYRTKTSKCLSMNSTLIDVIKNNVATSLIGQGEIVSPDGNTLIDHQGVFNHELSCPLSNLEFLGSEKFVFGDYIFREKKIKLAESNFFERKKILIENCFFSEGINVLTSFKGYAYLDDDSSYECWVHPKTLSSVCLIFESLVRLIPYSRIAIFKKKGKNSKVLITGDVHSFVDELSFKGGSDEEPENNIDPLLDF